MADGHEVPRADTQYRGQSHEVLKTWTDQGEPGDADGLGQTWKEMGQGLTEAAENLMVAVFGSQAGWTGQAAEAMRKHLQKVAEWSQKTGDSYKKASEAFVTQGESVGTAKTSMPDPVDYNPGQMIKDAATSGSIVEIAMLPVNMYQQRQAQQQAHEKAIQVVAQRDAELAAAAASIPPFEPPPKIEDPGGKEPGPNQPGMPGSSGPRPGMPGGGSRGGVGGGGGGGAGGGGGGLGGGGGIPGFPGGGAGGGGFGPNDPNNPNGGNGEDNQQTPPNVGMPSLPVGSGTGTSGFSHTPTNFGGGGPGGLPPGGIPGGAGPAGGGGGFGGAFGGGFGPGGAPRPGGGFGAMGPGAAAGGAGGAGAGTPGAGMAGGRGAGMAGGRGAGGMGAGGMGAGRGQGGEDDEHQRPSYLVEPDPDATFGTDQMTAPPVIGG